MIEKLDLLDSSIGSLSSYEVIEKKIKEIVDEVNLLSIMFTHPHFSTLREWAKVENERIRDV